MIKNLLLLMLILSCGYSLTAQLFSDDFESYAVGEYVGNESETWTTWSGVTGTTEDAKVVNDKAKSGTNSIYFYSTAQGPQDVVLDFGQKFTSGTFSLSFSLYITDGTSAYWNFQQETTIGTTWAGNAYYRNNGVLSIDASDQEISIPFNTNAWNDISYEIDLDNNEWIIRLNGECVGTLLAPAAVASLDIFPLTQNTTASEFWIDDVSFDHEPSVNVKVTDAVLTNGGPVGAAFVGELSAIATELHNVGTENITDVELTISSNGTVLGKETFENLALTAGDFTTLSIADILDPKQGINEVEIALTAINGFGSDDVPCNNKTVIGISGINKTPGKRVVVEENTGTWCGWCPRGHVFMEEMAEKYGDLFIGVAVHGGDVMEVEEHADYASSFPGVSGYPSAVVDREVVIDPSGIESVLIERLQEPIDALLDLKATYDEDLKELVVTVTLDAVEDISSSRRIGVMITEDEVTGTTAQYNQVNYYAGGTSGTMGGYEILPDPVPASQMVYEQVSRAILPTATGMAVGEAVPAGEKATYTFGMELSDEINLDHVNIIAFLGKVGLSREITTAFSLSFDDAEANSVNNEELKPDLEFVISPNPTTNQTSIAIEIPTSSEVSLELYSMTGQLVQSRYYGKLSGNQLFNLDVNELQAGIYNVLINVDGNKTSQRIVVTD